MSESKKTPARMQLLSVSVQTNTAELRTAELHDIEYTVIPAVILVEDVIQASNAPYPELATANVFGKFPASWDGRPVVMNHPYVDGAPVSAGSPEIREQYAFGFLSNTKVEDNKLLSEIWIDETRAAELGGDFADTVDRLKSDDVNVEVSTGAFIEVEMVKGTHNNQAYNGIWRNVVPDHLAVLAQGMTGACSIANGCGAPRINGQVPVPTGNAAGTKSVILGEGDSIAHLRAVTPALQLAPPAQEPHHNCSCDGDTSPEAKCTACKNSVVALQAGDVGTFRRLLQRLGTSLGMELKLPNSSADAIRAAVEGVSDKDLFQAVFNGLSVVEDEYVYVIAIFNDQGPNSGRVVYEAGWDGSLYMREYTFKPEGSIQFGSERTRVTPITSFVPLDISVTTTTDNPTEDLLMNKEETVKGLIANEANKFTQEDQQWLMALEEAQLSKIAAESTPVSPTANAADPAPTPAPTTVPTEGGTEAPTVPVTLEQYIGQAPVEIQSVLTSGIELHRKQKTALVDGLLANSKCPFSKEQLAAKDLNELQALATLAAVEVADFTAAGATLKAAGATGSDEAGYSQAPNILEALNPTPTVDPKTAH